MIANAVRRMDRWLGAILVPTRQSQRFTYREDDAIERPFDWGQFRRLLTYLRPYRRTVLRALVLTLVGSATRLALPYILGVAIDRAILPGKLGLLNALALAYLGLQLTYWVLSWLRIRLTNRVGQSVLRDLRAQLFRHIQGLSFNYFDGRPAGKILVRLTNDVNALNDLLSNGVINTLSDAFTLAGIIVILLGLEWKLALLSFVTLPGMFMISTNLRRRIRLSWQHVRIRLATINAHLNESLQGMRITQAFTQQDENQLFFANLNHSYYRSFMAAVRQNAYFGPLVELTGAIGTGLVFWYGTTLVRQGVLKVGTLVAFISYVGNFWEPVSRIGQVYSTLLVAMASSERIFEILDTPAAVRNREGAESAPIRGHVAFEEVRFAYEPGREALKGVTFVAEPGQTVALVGHTGAGKTSIVNLLARFYDATGGRVLIDGRDVRQFEVAALRSQMAFVLQETFIFSGTIADNIRYGKLDATDEEVEEAAKAVYAHEFIVRKPNGYLTEVKERGSGLSAGQRQLLSFARAILADPRILILDEATSAIDTQTEVLIQKALGRLLKGRTSFVVAHRLSTIRAADLILVLDHGVVVEAGRHHDLVSRGGKYAQLLEAQYRFLEQVGD